MRLLVFRAKMLHRDVRVFLRGCEAGMAQKFLDSTEIRSPLEQVSGKRMPQRMRRKPPARGKAHAGFFDQPLDVASVQPPATDADEHRDLAILFRKREAYAIPLGEVSLKGPVREFAERNDPLLPALSKHPDKALLHIEVFIVESDEFPDPQSAGIEQFEDGAI